RVADRGDLFFVQPVSPEPPKARVPQILEAARHIPERSVGRVILWINLNCLSEALGSLLEAPFCSHDKPEVQKSLVQAAGITRCGCFPKTLRRLPQPPLAGQQTTVCDIGRGMPRSRLDGSLEPLRRVRRLSAHIVEVAHRSQRNAPLLLGAQTHGVPEG